MKTLRYYQGLSDVNDVTTKFDSYQVFHSKAECEKHFPDGVVEFTDGDIGVPVYVDIPMINAENKMIAEIFDNISQTKYSTYDDEDLDESENIMYMVSVLANNDIIKDFNIQTKKMLFENDIEFIKEDLNTVMEQLKRIEPDVFAIYWED